MKTIVLASVVTLFLVSSLGMALEVRPVTTSGAIYIRADGSIDPPTANITTLDSVTYTLTGNITSDADGIVIERGDIIVDGAGYTLRGVYSGAGCSWVGIDHVTVRNMTIRLFQYGVRLNSSSGSHISRNDLVTGNYGVYLDFSSNTSISGNNITGMFSGGIRLDHASGHNSISGNTLVGNLGSALRVDSSADNMVENNVIAYNSGNGIALVNASGNTFVGNTIAANAFQGFNVHSSTYNTISGNNITNNDAMGLRLVSSSDNIVSGNRFTGDGLDIWMSYPNTVVNNTVNGKPLVYLEDAVDSSVGDAGQVILVNCDGIRVENLNLSQTRSGVLLWETDNSVIAGNHISANRLHGVYLHLSSNNTVAGNSVTGNTKAGIYIDVESNGNIVDGNSITDNGEYGIAVGFSSANCIRGNLIARNKYSLYISLSSNNKVYHNNFVNNAEQAFSSSSSATMWDNNYPSGGNYWSDYTDVDVDGDGVWDHPYAVDEYNQDRFPLTTPYGGPSGDVDGDRDVDIFDLVQVASCYGAVYPDDRYDRLIDLDLDGDINIFDLVIAAVHYGESW